MRDQAGIVKKIVRGYLICKDGIYKLIEIQFSKNRSKISILAHMAKSFCQRPAVHRIGHRIKKQGAKPKINCCMLSTDYIIIYSGSGGSKKNKFLIFPKRLKTCPAVTKRIHHSIILFCKLIHVFEVITAHLTHHV
jgi:hypothetical protein